MKNVNQQSSNPKRLRLPTRNLFASLRERPQPKATRPQKQVQAPMSNTPAALDIWNRPKWQ